MSRTSNLIEFSKKIEQLQEETVSIFILATHYDGDPPDDAAEFSTLLKSKARQGFSSAKKMAIFGLGDSNYTLYNNFAKSVYKMFKENGVLE